MARGSIRWISIGIFVALVFSACSGAMLEPGLAAKPSPMPQVVAVPATPAQPAPAKPTPSTPAEYLQRAEEAYAAGDMENAVVYYTEVIRHSPRDADSHYRRGLAQHGLGNIDRAISDYDVSLQINNERADIYCDRALAYEQKGNAEKAMGNFRACEMLASNPRTIARAESYLRERGVEP
jgi:tetratricopeptide (TPR) repeat protein